MIYRLDPRTKLLFVLMFTVLVFLVDKFTVAVILLISFIIFRMAVKIPFYGIKYIKNLSLLAIFIILMQTIFATGENYFIKPIFPPSFPVFGGMGSLKWDGFILGLVVVCRLVSVMVIFPVFTETSSPYSLAVGLCGLGFNYRTAFIITTVFNLIPLFKEEALVIIDAQKLRGMYLFERRSFFARLKAYSGLVLPLVLGAMRKAQVSSVAMDSRAFGVYKTRTWLDKPVMKMCDYFFIFACIVFSAAVLFFNYSEGLEFLCPVR
jgi:energy-coupling factor transport system permease protein